MTAGSPAEPEQAAEQDRLYQSAPRADTSDQYDGGPGSGNWGHVGNPPNRGGSKRNPNAAQRHRIPTDDGGFTSQAQIRRALRQGGGQGGESGGGGPDTGTPGNGGQEGGAGGNGGEEQGGGENGPDTPEIRITPEVREELNQFNRVIDDWMKDKAEVRKIEKAHGLKKIWFKFKHWYNSLIRLGELHRAGLTDMFRQSPEERAAKAREMIDATIQRLAESTGATPSDVLMELMRENGAGHDSRDDAEEPDMLSAAAGQLRKELETRWNAPRYIQTWKGKDGLARRIDMVFSTGDPRSDFLFQLSRDGDELLAVTGCSPGVRYEPTEDPDSEIRDTGKEKAPATP